MTKCPGYQRHRFGVHKGNGIQAPTCHRCGAANPGYTEAKQTAYTKYLAQHPKVLTIEEERAERRRVPIPLSPNEPAKRSPAEAEAARSLMASLKAGGLGRVAGWAADQMLKRAGKRGASNEDMREDLHDLIATDDARQATTYSTPRR